MQFKELIYLVGDVLDSTGVGWA